MCITNLIKMLNMPVLLGRPLISTILLDFSLISIYFLWQILWRHLGIVLLPVQCLWLALSYHTMATDPGGWKLTDTSFLIHKVKYHFFFFASNRCSVRNSEKCYRLFHMVELTDVYGWLVSCWLTEFLCHHVLLGAESCIIVNI